MRIGGVKSCQTFSGPVLHACQVPCWHRVAGKLEGRPGVVLGTCGDLYLNMVDSVDPKFIQVYQFLEAFKWLDEHDNGHGDVLIHCNRGISRAPSILLAWRARNGLLSRHSYTTARAQFEYDYPYYPGAGLVKFLTANWQELMG